MEYWSRRMGADSLILGRGWSGWSWFPKHEIFCLVGHEAPDRLGRTGGGGGDRSFLSKSLACDHLWRLSLSPANDANASGRIALKVQMCFIIPQPRISRPRTSIATKPRLPTLGFTTSVAWFSAFPSGRGPHPRMYSGNLGVDPHPSICVARCVITEHGVIIRSTEYSLRCTPYPVAHKAPIRLVWWTTAYPCTDLSIRLCLYQEKKKTSPPSIHACPATNGSTDIFSTSKGSWRPEKQLLRGAVAGRGMRSRLRWRNGSSKPFRPWVSAR